jgi:archaellin
MRKIVVASVAALLMLGLAATASAATTATLSPTSGTPTSTVTVTGTGFDASAAIDIYVDTTNIAITTSNASGAVSATVTMPASAQPGTHWVTLDEERTHAAAQASFVIDVQWPQSGFGPSKRSFNPYENTLSTGNVSQLVQAWSQPLDGFANSKPIIVYGNYIFLKDADQVIRAFSQAGKLEWSGSTPFEMFPDALAPAAYNGKVYFADNNGNVVAYNYLCRTDGGACTPAWTTNIGAGVEGGITVENGLLYVPAADGSVHVLNPATGAPGTSIVVTTTGALSTWIAFPANGGGYVGYGERVAQTRTNTGGGSDVGYSGTVSQPVVGADQGSVTTMAATLQQLQFGWSAALSGTGCNPTPAYADGVVFAAGCSSLGAYDAGSGGALWTISTSGGVQGLSVANGVLYACIGSQVVAYAASYGGRLWSGGHCSAAPVIVDGTMLVSYADVSAYTLSGADKTSRAGNGTRRPDPRLLRPSRRLKRRAYGARGRIHH